MAVDPNQEAAIMAAQAGAGALGSTDTQDAGAAVEQAAEAVAEEEKAIKTFEDALLKVVNVIDSLPFHFIVDHKGGLEEVRQFLLDHGAS